MEARRQHVHQEAPEELHCVEAHRLDFALVAVVLPVEDDAVVLEALKPVVADRHPMGVARQVLQATLGAAEWRLAIDYPRRGVQLLEPALVSAGLLSRIETTRKDRLSSSRHLSDLAQELATKQATEDLDRKEEVTARGDPPLPVW